MSSKEELVPKVVKQQNLTGVDPSSEAEAVVTSQGIQGGVARVVRSMEEERNATIALLVVALDM